MAEGTRGDQETKMSEPRELIPEEFRKDVVTKLIRNISTGNTKIDRDFEHKKLVNKDEREEVSKAAVELIAYVVGYFVNDIPAKDRELVEKNMFRDIVILRTFDLIIDKEIPDSKIDELNQKLESNNKLLMGIMNILREVLKRLEALEK